MLLAAVHVHRQRAAVSVTQRRFEGFREALSHFRAHLDAVNDHIDGVLGVLLQSGRCVDVMHRAVDAHPDEALRAQLVDQPGSVRPCGR